MEKRIERFEVGGEPVKLAVAVKHGFADLLTGQQNDAINEVIVDAAERIKNIISPPEQKPVAKRPQSKGGKR